MELSQSKKDDGDLEGAMNSSGVDGEDVLGNARDFHQQRIQGVMAKINDHTQKQESIEKRLQAHFDIVNRMKEQAKSEQQSTASGLISWFKSKVSA